MSTRPRSPSPSAAKRKRARRDVEPQAPGAASELGAPLRKDSAYWHEDGNIIIIVQGDVAYRIHKGVLARRSGVFRTLFSLPQPEGGRNAETMDGCPVVRLQDSEHDFSHLLQALYDGMDICVEHPDVEPMYNPDAVGFSALAALVRMANKYDMDRIRNAAIWRLRKFFTNKFSTWAAYEAEFYHNPHSPLTPVEIIEAVNILRDCGPIDMLPVALYLCAGLEIPTILRGAAHPDGRIEMLAVDDVERCLVGREKLEARSADFNNMLLHSKLSSPPLTGWSSSSSCETSTCYSSFNAKWKKAAKTSNSQTAIQRRGQFLALFKTPKDRDPASRSSHMCTSCNRAFHLLVEKFKVEVWNDLPSIMDIEVPHWMQEDVRSRITERATTSYSGVIHIFVSLPQFEDQSGIDICITSIGKHPDAGITKPDAYDMEVIRESAARRLKTFFSDRFSDWVAYNAESHLGAEAKV
ncbi:hypothetical protein C2E23DRAFT_888437 [Lenzites betulinus]|nr:hypothetical protein C2E23DRAFT_888437 [Lenzites betulinus]